MTVIILINRACRLKYMINLFIILVFNSSIYAMSGDGVGNPTTIKEETVRESIYTKPDGVIVYGVDTGLTKKEYEQFRKDYRAAVDKHDFSKKYHFPWQAYQQYLEAQINLNSLDKLIELGLRPGPMDNSYSYGILFDSRIILTGQTTDSMKYTYKNGKKQGTIWEFKIDKILKGSELLNDGDKEGCTIYLSNYSLYTSTEVEYFPNTNYILFIKQFQSYPKSDPPTPYYTGFKGKYVIDGDFVYGADLYKTTMNDLTTRVKHRISLKEYLELVKKVLLVNDSRNFYKRNYK